MPKPVPIHHHPQPAAIIPAAGLPVALQAYPGRRTAQIAPGKEEQRARGRLGIDALAGPFINRFVARRFAAGR